MNTRIIVNSRFVPYLTAEDDCDITAAEIALIDKFMAQFNNENVFIVSEVASGFNSICDISGEIIIEYSVCVIEYI